MCHLSTYQGRTWYGNEGIKNTEQGDRKVLFLFLASITPQTQAHEPMLTIILRYMHWILQHVGSRKHRHRSTKNNMKICLFVFFIIKPTPYSAFIKSRCITENPQESALPRERSWPGRGGLVSAWSWKELPLLTTMRYFKLRFSRWACKDVKDLKCKDVMA